MTEKTRETNYNNYTVETLLYTEMQTEIDGMKFEVNIYFPKENAETVSDKLRYLAQGES